MKVVEALMAVAAADTELLQSMDAKGDRFSISRDVDFLLLAPDQSRAELVAGFINDHQYGRACVQQNDGNFSIIVVVHMPVTQNEILSVSGFMVCLSHLYDLEYDGWGCEIQQEAQAAGKKM